MNKLCVALSIAVGLAGCLQEGEREDDGRDDVAVTDDKADAFGYHEGTPEALGILKVANEVSLADLKDHGKVGITSTAANGIVGKRPFASLTALDAVPFVGKVTFGKLLAYAQKMGWVTNSMTDNPFDPLSCSGVAMTHAEALSHFAPGTSETLLGSFVLQAISRRCNVQTGCGAWGAPRFVYAGVMRLTAGTQSVGVRLTYQGPGGPDSHGCGSLDAPECHTPYVPNALTGVVTNHCVRLTEDDQSPDFPGSANYNETVRALLIPTIAPGCKPMTCADNFANCGDVSDGCGGTLQCGTCSGADTCGGNLKHIPNQCGHDPCGPDQVSCPGFGGCYDACS